MMKKLLFLFYIIVSMLIFANENNNKLKLNNKEKEFLKNNPVIRVSNEMDFPPFDFSVDGKALGYSVDLFNLLAEKIGIDIEYINGYSWSELLLEFKNNKIDVLTSISKSKQREEIGIYSKSYFSLSYSLITLKNSPDIENVNQLYNKKISIGKGWVHESYFKENYPEINLVYYNNLEELLESVIKGETSATIADNVSVNYYIVKKGLKNLKIGSSLNGLEKSGVNKLHFMAQKNSPELISMLNKAFDSLSVEEFETLNRKWFGNNQNGIISRDLSLKPIKLSAEERLYLDSKKVLKMSALPDWLPFEAINENGEHTGISAELINLIEDRLGIKIELVPTKTWAESLSNIKERKVDILPIATNLPSRKEYMNFTTPLISEAFVIATKNNENFITDPREIRNKKVGIIKDYAVRELLKKSYPHMQIVDVDNVIDGLEKIRKKELFAYIDSMSTVGYTMQTNSMLDLKIAGKLEFDLHLSIASRNDEPLLAEIMQKAVNSLSDEEKRRIISNWISIRYEKGFNYSLLLKVLAVVFVLIIINIFSVLYSRKLTRLNKEIETHMHSEVKQKAMAVRLNKIFNKITSSTDINDVLELITVSLLALVDAQVVDIFIKEEDEYILTASNGKNISHDDVGTRIPEKNVLFIEKLKETKAPLYIEDLQKVDLLKYGEYVKRIKSIIIAPLIQNDKFVGLMTISNTKIKKYTNEEHNVIDTFAKNVVIAIMNAKNYENINKLLKNEEKQKYVALRINEVFNEITSANNLKSILNTVIDNMIELIDARSIDIFISEKSNFRIIATGGIHSRKENIDLIIPKEEFIKFDELDRTKKTIYIKNVNESFEFRFGYGTETLKSTLIAPLIFNNKIIGIINFNSDIIEAFTSEDIAIAGMFARNTAIAINNARYLNEINEKNSELEERNNEVELINSSLEEANQKLNMTISGANLLPIEFNFELNQLKYGISYKYHEDFDGTLEGFFKCIHPNDLDIVRESFQKHLAGKSSFFNQEFRFKIYENKYIWLNSIAKVMKWNEHNKALRMVGINLDISERKNSEIQLLKSEKMAALGQLVASIAHEINTPLGAINSSTENMQDNMKQVLLNYPELAVKLENEGTNLLFSNILKQGIANTSILSTREKRAKKKEIKLALEERNYTNAREISNFFISIGIYENFEEYLSLTQSDYKELIYETALNLVLLVKSIGVIKNSVQSASKIVYALKSYSRNDLSSQKKILNLKDSIDTVLTIYNNKIKYDIELIKEYPNNLSNIEGFLHELNQVWTNIIQNALQSMNFKGSLTIKISEEKTHQIVAISDTGSGIPIENREKIFEPFFTTKAEGEGTGLGLDIVKKIVEKHDGDIWFDSKPDIGTTFYIKLPILIK